MFSRLQAREEFQGTILDLFAGSGALGLEAASRGAEHVVMVEHHPGALKVIRSNIEMVSPSLASTTTLQARSARVESFLQASPTSQRRVCFWTRPISLRESRAFSAH